MRRGVRCYIQGHATLRASRAIGTTAMLPAARRGAGLRVLAGLCGAALDLRPGGRPVDWPREKYCFVFAASVPKVRSGETIGTLDLERRVIDVGRRGAGVPEGPVECRLWDRTAWVHIPAPRVQAMTLAILEESQLLRLKNGL